MIHTPEPGRGSALPSWKWLLIFVFASWAITMTLIVGMHSHPEEDQTGCRYWNVLTPADEIGDNFWIGGWTKDCGDGLLQPVIEFGPEEEAVEVLSRMENYIAIRESEWNSEQKEAILKELR